MNMLVRFAGHDPMETDEGYRRPVVAAIPRKAKGEPSDRSFRAYDLFKLGKDTAEIAGIMKIKEHSALRWVNLVRSYNRGLPSPYEAKR